MYLRRRHVKRLVSFLLAAALMMTVPAYAYDAPSGEAGLSNVAHVYAVKPGTDEWVSMSVEQRLASCRVTKAEVEAMTTEALIETIVNYPYLVNIFAYDTIEMGIEMVSNHFPGIEELFNREDAIEELYCYYDLLIERENKGVEDLRAGFKATAVGAILKEKQKNVETSDNNTVRVGVNTYVLTPSGRSVPAVNGYTEAEKYGPKLVGGETIEDHKDRIHLEFLTSYPGIYSVRPENPSYNCHSYAWYKRDTSNTYWIDDPTRFVTDESYSSANAAAGNIITYKYAYASMIPYAHSGVVSFNSNGKWMISSKWGAYRTYVHTVSNCPYMVDEGTPATPTIVEYWKLNPGYTATYQ